MICLLLSSCIGQYYILNQVQVETKWGQIWIQIGNNLTMQLVHLVGLLTFVLPTPNLFDIHVFLEEINKPLPKKAKKTMVPFAITKKFGLHNSLG
jgi:hypothetical protein